MKIYSIGHSTRSLEDFTDILKHFQVELVIDVRRFPGSRKFPWFKKENLEKELPKNQIEYLHFPELGGFRKGGYEEFTKTGEFADGLNKLIEIIDDKMVAIMCAEILWWKCHRRYIANALVEKGLEVTHVFNKEKIQEHKLRDKGIDEKMKLKIFCDKEVKE